MAVVRYTKLIVVKLEPAMDAELRRLAESEGRTLSASVRRLLAEALAYRRALADPRREAA